jgi:secretion/DNA translocation related TadE-like protein
MTRLREGGSVTVLTTGIMVVAAVLSLVSVDLLRALQGVGRAQTGADAAALAAAQEIALPTGLTPSEVASDYASRNGSTLVACTCEAGAVEAVVEVQIVVPFVILGPDRVVHASARAVIEVARPGPKSP